SPVTLRKSTRPPPIAIKPPTVRSHPRLVRMEPLLATIVRKRGRRHAPCHTTYEMAARKPAAWVSPLQPVSRFAPPRGIREPYDIAPRGSWHLSCVPI